MNVLYFRMNCNIFRGCDVEWDDFFVGSQFLHFFEMNFDSVVSYSVNLTYQADVLLAPSKKQWGKNLRQCVMKNEPNS
jgi:hypothetical protein